MSDFGIFESVTASESESKIARQAATDKLAAAIYDVREQYGAHLFCAKNKEEFGDRLALCKDDMMKTVNQHLMPVTGVMRRVCKTMEREWKQKLAMPYREPGVYSPYDPETDNYPGGEFGPAENRPKHADGVVDMDQIYLDVSKDPGAPYSETAGFWLDRGINDAEEAGFPDLTREELVELKRQQRNDMLDRGISVGPYGGRHMDEGEDDYGHYVVERDPGDYEGKHRKADKTGPDQNLDQTYSPSDGELIPDGDFHGYLDSVDQGAPSKVDRNFRARRRVAYDPTSGLDVGAAIGAGATGMDEEYQPTFDAPPGTGSSGTPGVGSGAMVPATDAPVGGVTPAQAGIGPSPSMTASVIKRYAQWCVANLARPSERTLEYYAANRPDREYFVLQAALMRHAAGAWGDVDVDGGEAGAAAAKPGSFEHYTQYAHRNGLHPGDALTADRYSREHRVPTSVASDYAMRLSSIRTAAGKDYLQQADEAITNLLNEKAEEFQESIQPLQQALQTIQYAEQMQQAQNPMNVMPPAGTVNVLPQGQAPQGAPPPGVDPSSGQVDPAMLAQLMGQGGMDPSMMGGGAPQGGPPPAALAQGAIPPELAQQMQMQARRRRQARSDDDENINETGAYERPFPPRKTVQLSDIRPGEKRNAFHGVHPDGHRVPFEVVHSEAENIHKLLGEGKTTLTVPEFFLSKEHRSGAHRAEARRRGGHPKG